ncbi:MAG: ABC transporter permease [Actinomycetota bacterium]
MLRRIGFMVFVVWGVTLVTFFLSRVVPGDPARLLAGPKASPVEIAHIRSIYGLDKPLLVQYGRYVVDLVHGNLGQSFVTRRAVTTDIATFLPATLELSGWALLIGFGLGLVFGGLAAYGRGTPVDGGSRLFAIAGLSVPAFWLALLLQLLFHTRLGWFPLGGRLSASVAPPPHLTGIITLDALLTFHVRAFLDALWHLVLPVAALAAGVFGLMTRIVRTAVLDVLGEDFVRGAEAKGLGRWRIIRRHVMRNAMLPAVTVLGLEFGLLASGVFVVEAVFQWPGIGSYAFQAIQASDYGATLGATLVIALMYVITNLVVDLAYLYLDPRIRYT